MTLSEQDSTLVNLPPTQSMMAVPNVMKGKIADIAAGRTYGVGLDTDGHLHTWGYTKITEKINIADIPDEVQNADLVMFAAGDDHVVALDADGQLYVWGNTRLQQGNFSSDMKKAMKAGGDAWDIIQLEASNQFSAALCSDGNLYLWGNGNMADIKLRKQYQGNIAKVALTSNEYICLLKDGTVAYTGYKDKGSAFAAIPAELTGKTVVDIAATSSSTAGRDRRRQGVVWGNANNGEKNVPAFLPGEEHLRRPLSTTPPCWRTAPWSPGAQQVSPDRRARRTPTAASKSRSTPATSRTTPCWRMATSTPGA